MNKQQKELITKAKQAALEVLLHNNHGAYRNLPRTAGWGYPEPYTRDLMICSLGILTTENKRLLKIVDKQSNKIMELASKSNVNVKAGKESIVTVIDGSENVNIKVNQDNRRIETYIENQINQLEKEYEKLPDNPDNKNKKGHQANQNKAQEPRHG